MNIDWRNIRTWNGSQNSGYEELCCQLAAYDPVPAGSKFTRKGAPDAGVECYWILPTGDEWAWQAKFFLARPTDEQWAQIDKSVETALDKHPRLVRYFVCVPVDRQDPRLDKQQWFMDKWEARVTTWQASAAARKMSVEFEYWGAHEIGERLTREAHSGRRLFWFGVDFFSPAWYRSRLDVAIANAGPRYTKDLNVELPISENFEAFGRNKRFLNRIETRFGELKKRSTKVMRDKLQAEAKDSFEGLGAALKPLLTHFEEAYKSGTERIDWQRIGKEASQARDLAWDCEEKLRLAEKAYKDRTAGEKKDPGSHGPSYDHSRYLLGEVVGQLTAIQHFSTSTETAAGNSAAILLVGDAGTGKTHLFCDAANHHLADGMPAVVLHGGHFDTSEPWSQIIRILGLTCSRDEFLGALQTNAEASAGKALIFIDALNEGQGKTLWKDQLAGMLAALSQYPQVGLAVSVRSSYENTIVQTGLVPDRLTRMVHNGFRGHEYEATEAFFAYYKIERPSIPILTPEFGRPLFLKVFCEALHKRGYTKVPAEISGMTSIFDFYLESNNLKLAQTLDFDAKDRLTQKAVESIARVMADRRESWLTRDEAKKAVDDLLPGRKYEDSLFRGMIAENLLIENQRPIAGVDTEIINFSYERFLDHRVCSYLLDKHVHDGNIEQAFAVGGPLASLFEDESAAWFNRGLLEALALQIPERYSKELPDAAPQGQEWESVRQAFIESLLWRKNSSFSKTTLAYVNKVLAKYPRSWSEFLQALLTVAANPDHPYNARLLHTHLMKQKMPERDSDWTIFISSEFGEKGAIDRLVEWAWSESDKSYVDDRSALLCSVAITWFFSSPNRFLRDSATKALVRLLTPRLQVVRRLVRLFKKVDDPYVWERVLAVAYGCALRNSSDKGALAQLAGDVYAAVFAKKKVPPHVLVRDYARGVIEAAVSSGTELGFDISRARPPYKSDLPTHIPSEEDLKKYGEWEEGMPDKNWAMCHLHSSVLGDEDFARYVIGSDGVSKWLDRRLGQVHPPTKKEKYEAFLGTLSEDEKKAFEKFEKSRNVHSILVRLDEKMLAELIAEHLPEGTKDDAEEIFSAVEAQARKEVREALSPEKRAVFDGEIVDYLDNSSKYHHELNFPIAPMQRWMFQRVLDLGWTVELFGDFDRRVNRHDDAGRSGHKAERVGKKYQWIAFFEMLALMADNYEIRSDRHQEKSEPYSGPWQFHTRDIDPSFLLRKTKRRSEESPFCWWCPSTYSNWDGHQDSTAWIKDTADLPDPKGLLEVVNPKDNSRWIVLDLSPKWRAPTPTGEESFSSDTKQLWYLLNSYIVKRAHVNPVFAWALKQDYWGRWMPEAKSLSGVFLGEHYWAPAYRDHDIPWHGLPGWTTGSEGRALPHPVLSATQGYFAESSGYDCSIDDTINITIPRKVIVDQMKLHWKGIEGHFYDTAGTLVAFDPSVKESGPGALLVRKDAFTRFLDAEDYSVLWTLLGEKLVAGTHTDWKGTTRLSGAYHLADGKIDGEFTTRFKGPDDIKKSA